MKLIALLLLVVGLYQNDKRPKALIDVIPSADTKSIFSYSSTRIYTSEGKKFTSTRDGEMQLRRIDNGSKGAETARLNLVYKYLEDNMPRQTTYDLLVRIIDGKIVLESATMKTADQSTATELASDHPEFFGLSQLFRPIDAGGTLASTKNGETLCTVAVNRTTADTETTFGVGAAIIHSRVLDINGETSFEATTRLTQKNK